VLAQSLQLLPQTGVLSCRVNKRLAAVLLRALLQLLCNAVLITTSKPSAALILGMALAVHHVLWWHIKRCRGSFLG
jgi:hypothetical protein